MSASLRVDIGLSDQIIFVREQRIDGSLDGGRNFGWDVIFQSP